MSSSAQRDLYEDAEETQQDLGATGTERAATLRRLALERLAAHRSKRAALEPQAAPPERSTPHISEAARRAREAVVARYRATPSYRETLATESRAAATAVVVEPPAPRWVEEPVRAAPSVVAAEPVLEAAQPTVVEPMAAAVLATPGPVSTDVEEDFAWLNATPVPAASFEPAVQSAGQFEAAVPVADVAEPQSMPVGEWQVRPFEELTPPVAPPAPLRITEELPHEEIANLDEEIAFRLAPEFIEHLIEPLPIQANIIEFPRQLVAARKARPRLAEGPLREDRDDVVEAEQAPSQPAEPEFQMRIFEVEPLPAMPAPQVSATPAVHPATQVTEVQAPPEPEWQHLVLDAAEEEDSAPSWVPAPVPEMPPVAAHAYDPEAALPVAAFELRLMAGVVDAICVGFAFVAFAVVAGWIGGRELRAVALPTLGVISAALLALLAIFYQALFFTLSHATPGMFYANLVFKTLAGREPSRRLLRRRVGANVLAALPLGLGLVWSLVDKRNLGWNDRISGIFLREY